MKNIKVFESYSEIDSICNEFGITNWTVNSDGAVDVRGSIFLDNKGFKKLPLKFGKVDGDFFCEKNKLVTLEGAPSEVGGSFDLQQNNLISLKGSPKKVGGYFDCSHNKLASLEGAPIEVSGGFICDNNQLTTLNGAPNSVDNGYFWCQRNKLISLEGAPSNVRNLLCECNPIFEVYKLFTSHKAYLYSLDYNYLRGTNIVKSRLEEALEEFGIELPESIPGYKYI